MKGLVLRAGIAALVVAAFGSQGCVPWKKYTDLKKRYTQMEGDLRAKEGQVSDDLVQIQTQQDQLKSKDQLIKLYEDKYKDATLIAQNAKAALDKMQTELDRRLKSIADRYPGGVEAGPGGLSIKSTLLFALGSADISQEGQKVLNDIAQEFKGTDEIIQIDGHTDDTPVVRPETKAKFGTNWGLSAMRACAVLETLAKGGIPERRMYVRAFSMYRPKASGNTEAERSQNRRVEVYFISPAGAAAASAEPKTE